MTLHGRSFVHFPESRLVPIGGFRQSCGFWIARRDERRKAARAACEELLSIIGDFSERLRKEYASRKDDVLKALLTVRDDLNTELRRAIQDLIRKGA